MIKDSNRSDLRVNFQFTFQGTVQSVMAEKARQLRMRQLLVLHLQSSQ